MARGIKDMKDGLIFGAAFGALVAYVALLPNTFLDWLGKGLHSMGNWLVSQDWWSMGFGKTIETCTTACVATDAILYTIAALIGALIGAYIDSS
jgi:hypothetical protein